MARRLQNTPDLQVGIGTDTVGGDESQITWARGNGLRKMDERVKTALKKLQKALIQGDHESLLGMISGVQNAGVPIDSIRIRIAEGYRAESMCGWIVREALEQACYGTDGTNELLELLAATHLIGPRGGENATPADSFLEGTMEYPEGFGHVDREPIRMAAILAEGVAFNPGIPYPTMIYNLIAEQRNPKDLRDKDGLNLIQFLAWNMAMQRDPSNQKRLTQYITHIADLRELFEPHDPAGATPHCALDDLLTAQKNAQFRNEENATLDRLIENARIARDAHLSNANTGNATAIPGPQDQPQTGAIRTAGPKPKTQQR